MTNRTNIRHFSIFYYEEPQIFYHIIKGFYYEYFCYSFETTFYIILLLFIF
jgi:hypothetical protein